MAHTFAVWPKVDGVGRVLVSSASVTFYSPTGNVVGGPTALSPVTVSGRSRLDVEIPALSDLEEDYLALLTYTPDSATHGAAEAYQRERQVLFDVVLHPWGESELAIEDLEDLRPSIRPVLSRIVEQLDPAGTEGLTAEALASRYCYRAHAELYELLRVRAAQDYPDRPLGFIRPRLILDRRRLNPIEVHLAMALIFAGIAGYDADSGEAHELAKKYSAEAQTRLGTLDRLTYDRSEDRVADSELTGFGAVHARRVRSR